VLALGALYQRYGQVPALDPVFRDLGAAAAGLVVATGLKIAQPHWRKPLSVMIAGSGFAAVGLGRVPLIWAVLVLAPLSVLLHWRRDR
jgi:chromate transporter